MLANWIYTLYSIVSELCYNSSFSFYASFLEGGLIYLQRLDTKGIFLHTLRIKFHLEMALKQEDFIVRKSGDFNASSISKFIFWPR